MSTTLSKITPKRASHLLNTPIGSLVKKWVEPGKFFLESMIKKGNVMPMPDIRDKMPKRSFLPHLISSKLPFSTSKILEMKQILHADDNSTMESMIVDSLSDCERAPSPCETKRCVSSAKDMIDFAISILGRNVTVQTTQNVGGSKQKIMIGSIKGITGGKVTQSVSCHQSLFPYLLYYCHSVPKVRVYEADILDPSSKAKINHRVKFVILTLVITISTISLISSIICVQNPFLAFSRKLFIINLCPKK
ncbi:polygalacturonase 1 beta-like protein 3 [Fagus crenata]